MTSEKSARALFLSTTAFVVSFVGWGLIATMASTVIPVGLGGFFPPLMLGVLRDATGTYTLEF